MTTGVKIALSAFDAMQAKDKCNERRVLWSEAGVAAFLALLVIGYVLVV